LVLNKHKKDMKRTTMSSGILSIYDRIERPVENYGSFPETISVWFPCSMCGCIIHDYVRNEADVLKRAKLYEELVAICDRGVELCREDCDEKNKSGTLENDLVWARELYKAELESDMNGNRKKTGHLPPAAAIKSVPTYKFVDTDDPFCELQNKVT
jgi:hypothetical protein